MLYNQPKCFYHQQSAPSQAAVFPFPREKTRPSNVENPAASADVFFLFGWHFSLKKTIDTSQKLNSELAPEKGTVLSGRNVVFQKHHFSGAMLNIRGVY